MKYVVQLKYTSEFVKKHLIETGEFLDRNREVEIDPRDLRPDLRERFVAPQLDRGRTGGDRAYEDLKVITGREDYGDPDFAAWEYNGPVDDPNALLDRFLEDQQAAKDVFDAQVDELVRRMLAAPEKVSVDDSARREYAWVRFEGKRVFRDIDHVDPRLQELVEGLRQAYLDAAAEEERQREEGIREFKRKQEDGVQRLKDWALEHGSYLLRARVEDGFDWDNLAEAEYGRWVIDRLDLQLPEATRAWEGRKFVKALDRTTPTLEEIELLRSVRRRIEERDLANIVAADLAWCQYEVDYDWHVDRQSRCELHLTVNCPNDEEREFWFLPKSDD